MINNLKRIIAKSKNPLLIPLKYIFYRFINNKYYEVSSFIKSFDELNSNEIIVTLKNGIKISSKKSFYPAAIQFKDRVKFGKKTKLKNIYMIDKYFFIYELISEAFINNEHFSLIDFSNVKVLIDAGANIGAFTLYSYLANPRIEKFYLIEPDEENCIFLEKNMKLNGINNYEIIKKGLWNKKGVLEFFINNKAGEHSLFDYNLDDNIKKVLINVDTLDNIINEYNIENIDLIKMDIEGAEINAFLKMKIIL